MALEVAKRLECAAFPRSDLRRYNERRTLPISKPPRLRTFCRFSNRQNVRRRGGFEIGRVLRSLYLRKSERGKAAHSKRFATSSAIPLFTRRLDDSGTGMRRLAPTDGFRFEPSSVATHLSPALCCQR